MTKRKKSKKKRNRTIKLLIVLFLVILGAAYYIYYGMNNKEKIINNDDKLKEIGYSEIEITSINKNSEYLKYALNNEYNDKLTSLIKNKDFKIEYIDAYMKYINDNKDVSIDNAIYLVNNDINYKYSDYLVELSKEKYFLKTRIERYINYKYSHNDLSNTEIIKRVNSDIDNSFYTNIVNSDTSYNNLLICNKYYKLSNTYTGNLVNIESGYTTRGGKLDSTAYEAFKKLSDDARNQGLHILSQSAYRSYNDQDYIYNNYLKTNGKEWTDKWSARPGHSEHQTGLALDVATYTTKNLRDFEATKEFTWMQENDYKYGFILRYPKNLEYITGYGYEPWHYRYVGIDAATIIHNENITFEEYYTYYVLKK